MKKEEHTHMVPTDIAKISELMGMLNSGKAQGKSVQQLEKLEAANLRLKDKVTELTKMLDASNDEKEQLNTTASKLKEKVTELTLMLDSSRSVSPPCRFVLCLSLESAFK
jgi:predicted  nucleic acid-binding Zn-ribbon protein